MVDQRTDEWENLDESRMRYHTIQWELPKRSTVAFERFCSPWLEGSERVIDVACGTGASTAYIAERHRSVHFVGIDLSPDLIAIGRKIIEAKNLANLTLETGDCFDLGEMSNVDGVMSIQTLSWLPDYEAPLIQIFDKLAPKWIAISSLFYAGEISCRTEVEEHRKNAKYFYNTYSLPKLARFAESRDYVVSLAEPFNIDVDIAMPEDPDVMGTYTRTISDGNLGKPTRLQISGPVLMNWYQILIERR
jgi:trans-aconitate methyltransferase